jgi:peptide/nickel transport system permease protein
MSIRFDDPQLDNRVAVLEQSEEGSGASQGALIIRRLLRKPTAVMGIIFLLLIIFSAILAPYLTNYDPARMSPRAALQPPGLEGHLLGTDHFGRDQLTRILYGGRVSLRVGLIAVSIAASFGIFLGALAGYWGGWIDEIISRFIDIMLAFPGILLSLGVIAVLGPGLNNLMIALGISGIPSFARLTRSLVLPAKQYDYVLAAGALGGSVFRLLLKHIMPNIFAPLMVYATLQMAIAILASAALNYLGLGAEPPTPEWGLMLAESRDYIRRAWWLATFPGMAIMLTVISINLFGDGLRDVLDPWLQGR